MQFDEQDNKNTPSRTFHPLQFALIAITIVLLITLGISYLVKPPSIEPLLTAPLVQSTPEAPGIPWKRYATKKGDTPAKLFKRIGLDPKSFHDVMSLSEVKSTLARLQTNQKVYVYLNPEKQLEKLFYMIDHEHYLEIYQQNGRYVAKTAAIKLTEQLTVAKGTVQSSLSTAMRKTGLSHNQVASFINLFNWSVNFTRQVHPGDRFAVIYTQYFSNNNRVKTGPILAAELVTRQQAFRAFAFKDRGNQINYYTETGESLRKAFIRTPTHYTHISSPFSYRRWHPILHIIRAHTGVDLAAPPGTPVYAASDGVIAFRGRRGGYGKVIVLKHSHDVTTVYAHLSQFASAFHVGSFVTEGKTIGFVGSTGLADGPHLHYEFRIHDVPYNPMTIKLPKADPIPKKDMPAFLDHIRKIEGLLNQPRVALSGVAVGTVPATTA